MSDTVEVAFPGSSHGAVRLNKGDNLSEQLTVQNSPVLFGCRTGICATCLSEVEGVQSSELASRLAPHSRP